ncbi:ankyrin repeat, PH and SEC7 domain containing protein secG-like [Schistocerca gregaria]|uniref:ankyrin repeat, PH and SEC7 domain containing protein secG-like n=1 Tax=Schistocerca gregaria TaxID=7010 RepID=UPI00211DA75B|nr:ankyrin repeat, PH and SEC7 domain containing protein secG-like [Schistocerca gregaria]
MTALMRAVPFAPVVAMLCERSAEIDRMDFEGRTAFFHAVIGRHEASAKILIEHGADPYIKDNHSQSFLSVISDEFKAIIDDAIKLRRAHGDVELSKKWKEAVRLFNVKPEKGIGYAVEEKLIEDTPDGVALFFLKENDSLNPQFMGEMLGRREEDGLRKAFVKRLNFENLTLDQAIREYLQKFLLPGEAQQISRIIECMAHRYVENNPATFPDEDTAFLLSFAIIILNTDAHNPNIPSERRMTKAQFIRNQRRTWGPNHEDPPRELLETLYDNILAEEIKFRDSSLTVKEGYLKKCHGVKFGAWKSYWCVLQNNCLFFYVNRGDKAPASMVLFNNLRVKKKDSFRKGRFSLVTGDGELISYCRRTNKGSVVQAKTHEIFLAAERPEEAEQWARAILTHITLSRSRCRASARGEVQTDEQWAREEMYLISRVVDFTNIYNLALLCESCYKTEKQIRSHYGTSAVACVAEVGGVHFFLLRDAVKKRTYLTLVGDLWTEQVKRAEWDPVFDWMEYFKVDSLVEAILYVLDAFLKPATDLQITGHSLGALVSIFLAIALQKKSFGQLRVTTFGQPRVMRPSLVSQYQSLEVVRVVDVNDPVDTIFSGCIHIGHQITLLKQVFFSYALLKNLKHVQFDLDQDHSIAAASAESLEEEGRAAGAAESSKTKKASSLRDRDLLKEKRGMKPFLIKKERLEMHSIAYYIERIQQKLKVATQNVEVSQIDLYR